MRLKEIEVYASPIEEQNTVPPLSADQLRKRNERDAKRLKKAGELTRSAAIKAADIRADLGK